MHIQRQWLRILYWMPLRIDCDSGAVACSKLATGPYKAARDAYVAATATYTKSLYE